MTGVFDEIYGEAGHTFIIAESESELSEEDVIGFCRERLAAYKLPRKVTFLPGIPGNPSGEGSQVSLEAEFRRGLMCVDCFVVLLLAMTFRYFDCERSEANSSWAQLSNVTAFIKPNSKSVYRL